MLNIIRVAVYELVYSPQTADYAIVNSAVENCRLIAGKKQVGFVNAVLATDNKAYKISSAIAFTINRKGDIASGYS